MNEEQKEKEILENREGRRKAERTKEQENGEGKNEVKDKQIRGSKESKREDTRGGEESMKEDGKKKELDKK